VTKTLGKSRIGKTCTRHIIPFFVNWLAALRAISSRIFFSNLSDPFSDPDKTRGIVDFLARVGNGRHPHHRHNFSFHLAAFQFPNQNQTRILAFDWLSIVGLDCPSLGYRFMDTGLGPVFLVWAMATSYLSPTLVWLYSHAECLDLSTLRPMHVYSSPTVTLPTVSAQRRILVDL